MKKKILYLFNSPARPAYRDNLLKIVATPVGGKAQFRYSTKYHVPPSLGDLPRKCDALIVFVDRHSEGAYTYYPIRKAKVLNIFRKQNRLFVECRLSEYYGTDNTRLFTERLKEIGDRSPELTNDDPDSSDDGYYVQFANDITDELDTDSECWFHTVKSISQTAVFKNEHTAFLNLSLKRSKKEQDGIIRGNKGLAFLNSGENYSLDIFYYDPDQGKIDKNLAISFNEPLENHGPDYYSFGALTDNLQIDFKTKKTFSSHRTSVNLVVETEGTEKYHISLPIQVSSRNLLYGTLFYSLIIISSIVSPKYWLAPDSELYFMFELIRWLAVIRLFVKFGSIPNLALQ